MIVRLRSLAGSQLSFAVFLALALLLANVLVLPGFVEAGQLSQTLGTLAPLVLVGMASTPSFLSGGGGIDLSITPLMALINIILVTKFLGTTWGDPEIAIPILVAVGAAIGAINGMLIAWLRFPPVIATLGMFFVLSGVDLALVPTPVTAPSSGWVTAIAADVGPIPGALFMVGVPLAVWGLLRRTNFADSVLAVGDQDAAAFSAGMNVGAVRIWAYALGGTLAAVAGIALTGLVQSADATTFSGYTIAALAAVALGGTNLAGGRGGLFASAIGATCIYLVENLLASLGVSAQYVQVAYGGVLLVAIVLGVLVFNRKERAA